MGADPARADRPCGESAPNTATPRVQRVITARRGQIVGFQAKEGWQGWDEVQAYLPAATLYDLIIEICGLSHGMGFFTWGFDHLAACWDARWKPPTPNGKRHMAKFTRSWFENCPTRATFVWTHGRSGGRNHADKNKARMGTT